MINRRRFMATVGATAILPAASRAVSEPAAVAPMQQGAGRIHIDLAGEWERYVAGSLYDRIPVPSSQRPLGFYSLQRNFLLPRLSPRQRAILHFDAITYYGRASVNGAELGTMGPYVPYEFDFSTHAKEGGNRIEAAIADLTPAPSGAGKDELALGLNPGWEAYGGIIRDVYVEVRSAAFIHNVKFGYSLSSNYTRADCRATVFVSSQETRSARIELSLEQGQSEVAHAEKSFRVTPEMTEVDLQFNVHAPALWSPEAPNLYHLKVTLQSEGGEDEWRTRTGFREVTIDGNEFLLNGKPVVLKGVCRHDMWKDEGFTLTRPQREQDMRMIKDLGCNFVRLVHYPHDRQVIELADELGLLVSEEPGYWGMDFTTMPRSMIEVGYNILERTIRRDWNSPSVFAWLLGNECKLTVEYLREGKERCRRLDPLSRPISFANDMPMEQAKPIFEQAGLDFFDEHIYTFNPDDFTRAAHFYGASKPFIASEWGAMVFGQSRPIMEQTVDILIELATTKQMAGHSYWEWADMMEFSRTGWMLHDGVLGEGVVTQSREPREEVHMELGRLFEGRLEAREQESIRPTVIPLQRSVASFESKFTPVDLQSQVDGSDSRSSWAAFEASMAKHWAGTRMARHQWQKTGAQFLLWQAPDVKVAGIPFRTPLVGNHVRPLVLTPETPEITIPLRLECQRLHILGQVTFPEGFPIVGREGEQVATYRLRYADGKEQVIPVRNGFEVAQANLICGATRVNPVATAAPRALLFVKDAALEHYQVLLLPLPVRKGTIESLTCKLEGQNPPLAIFAITAEHA